MEKLNGIVRYTYDAAGNIETDLFWHNTFDAADQLIAAEECSLPPHCKHRAYTYNGEGERTGATPPNGPATAYGYNKDEELISVQRPEEGTTTKIEDSYAYNGEGVRTSQTVAGMKSYLIWDEAEGLPTLLDDGANSYIYGPEGLPIEQVNNSTGAVVYMHHDQQGSTRLLTSSTGEVVRDCSYGPYGTPSCVGSVSTPLGYDGEYTNADTGLQYLSAREYDPETGEFMSVDPLSRWTHAPYAYGLDDPLRYYDPTGLVSFGEVVGAVEDGGQFLIEHRVEVGLGLGAVAFATGGAAVTPLVESGALTTALGYVSAGAGSGATTLDTDRCIGGDPTACVGTGLGIAALGLGGPEALASRGLIPNKPVFQGLAGGGLVIGGYGTVADLVTGAPNFLEPLFSCP